MEPRTAKLPPPKSSVEFEELVLEIFRARWGIRTERYGRSGQRQHGVDIIGYPQELGGNIAAIQCKNTARLTIASIRKEVALAMKFRPKLGLLLFASSGERDSKLQDATRGEDFPLPVALLFWEDLLGMMDDRVLNKHYGFWSAPVQPEQLEAVAAQLMSRYRGMDFHRDAYAVKNPNTDGSIPPLESGEPRGVRASVGGFVVYAVSRLLALKRLEPEQERAFHDAIPAYFPDDAPADALRRASLLCRNGRVVFEHAPQDLSFDRRWYRWSEFDQGHGATALAATLPDLHRPGFYSAADLALDLRSFVRMTGALCDGAFGPADTLFVLAYDPGSLEVAFEPSNVVARTRLGARLDGIGTVAAPFDGVADVAKPKLDGRTSVERAAAIRVGLDELRAHSSVVAAQLLVPVLREQHRAQIDADRFAASIETVAAAIERSRRS